MGSLVCLLLTLTLALAAPGASVAWVHGGHVTPEQVALHNLEDAEGVPYHHGERATDASTSAADGLGMQASHKPAVPGVPQVQTGSTSSPAPTGTMQAGLAYAFVLPDSGSSERLTSYITLPPSEPAPSPPGKPPQIS